MKVYLPVRGTKTGKGKFITKLSKFLPKYNIEVGNNPLEKYDIALHVINKDNNIISKKHIIRLDGIYFDSTNRSGDAVNISICKHRNKCDGVIYQSKFSEKMCNKYLGEFNGKSIIIPNGDDPLEYESIEGVETSKKAFLAFSNWHRHKRLPETIEAFLQAEVEDSILWVIGKLQDSGLREIDIKKYEMKKNIIFLGELSHSELSRYLKSSMAYIFLSYVDNCPNSIIEAISAGCPVICGNFGGTPELIDSECGFVCNTDPDGYYEKQDLSKNIKKIKNLDEVSLRIRELSKNKMEINKYKFDIRKIAKEYASFFERIINE